MGTTYTNGTMKASRLSELEQVILRLAGKPQFTYPDWESLSNKPFRDIIAYMEKAQPHYKRLLAELDPSDPIEAWAIHMIRGKSLPPVKCAALAKKFEALLDSVAEYEKDTPYSQPDYYFFSLHSLLVDHIQALKQCHSRGDRFEYRS